MTTTNLVVPDYALRYAPLVWLHSEDIFRPADILEHLHHTTPLADQKVVPNLPTLDLDNLAILNNVEGGNVALTSNDNITSLPTWLFGQNPDEDTRVTNATPCIIILVDKGALNLDAFYFYFYSYNRGPNITQVLEPINSLVGDLGEVHFGDHVGDWEYNMIRFHAGKPTGIFYSQHDVGAAYNWGDADLTMRDERPFIFSAYGSHANYPSAGHQVHDSVLVDYCDEGRLWDPVLSAYFYRLNPATFKFTMVSPYSSNVSSNLNRTSFLHFNGPWGDAEYADDNPDQATVPLFGLKRYISGPKGPAFKQLIREGLFPDKLKSKTSSQWVVETFMPWYRCCLRGGRIWVSGIMFIVSVIFVALGARCVWKRYKKNGYERVDTAIPLEDLRQ